MRLSKQEVQAIQTNFEKFFDEGVVYLFGSRVDDSKKGGDIDLYITTKNRENLVEKRIKFASRLARDVDYKKVDVVLDYGEDRLIDKIAKEQGVVLCKKS